MWVPIRKYLSPPVFPADEQKTRIAGRLNAILLVVLLLAVIFAVPTFVINQDLNRILVELVLIGTTIGIIALMRRGYVRLASGIFLSILLIIVSIANIIHKFRTS